MEDRYEISSILIAIGLAEDARSPHPREDSRPVAPARGSESARLPMNRYDLAAIRERRALENVHVGVETARQDAVGAAADLRRRLRRK